MAKSKNHTNKNQSYKNHRNGIKRIPRKRTFNPTGVDFKYLKVLKKCRAQAMKDAIVRKAEKIAKIHEARKPIKEKALAEHEKRRAKEAADAAAIAAYLDRKAKFENRV